MISEEKIAGDLIRGSLAPFFSGRTESADLGRKALVQVRVYLQRKGIHDDEAVQDVFAIAVESAYSFLRDHSADEIRDPERWFLTVCSNAASRYLNQMHREQRGREMLSEALAGEAVLPDVVDERYLKMVREAISRLPSGHRRFILLDLVEGLPADKIQARLSLSPGYFRKLKAQAFSALRRELLALVEQSGSASLPPGEGPGPKRPSRIVTPGPEVQEPTTEFGRALLQERRSTSDERSSDSRHPHDHGRQPPAEDGD